LGSSVALWLGHGRARHTGTTGSPLAQIETRPALPVALHFEDISSTRGPEDEPETVTQRLPRGQVSLAIYLPSDNVGGSYEIALLHKQLEAPVIKFEGVARPEGAAIVLRANADISGIEPATYFLGFRPAGGRWRYGRIVVF